MIERYLKPGVRVEWSAPAATQQALDWTKADEWCIGGVKSVPAMNRAALIVEMNKI